jgi:Mrp family chromosome partitioning ATPase
MVDADTAHPARDLVRREVPVDGLLVDDHEAMIWRGPMVMSLMRQLLQQAAWGPLDVLVVDLPPGTGDAQLTLIQAVDLAGAVIVTTPQDVALADAIRGITMFQKLEVPLLGLVENMAYYELPDGVGTTCSARAAGPGGGEATGRTCSRRSRCEPRSARAATRACRRRSATTRGSSVPDIAREGVGCKLAPRG